MSRPCRTFRPRRNPEAICVSPTSLNAAHAFRTINPTAALRAAVLASACKVRLTFPIRCAMMQMSSELYIFGGGDLLKNRIEEIRNAKGLRQEEFAKAMGVSRQTISSLENGRYNPSILLAYKIARYFGLTIEEVFIFEEE